MHVVSAMRSWFFGVLLGEVWRSGMGRLVVVVGWGASSWEEHQGNAGVLDAACITPSLSGSGRTFPLGLPFIYTDEGSSGLGRLRMRMREKVNSSGQHRRPRNTHPAHEWGAHPCPPGTQHSLGHVATRKASGIQPRGRLFVCYCRCHFLLFN